MDSDFILTAIIALGIVGLVVLLVWMKSRGRRQVVKAITAVQEPLKLTLFVGTHPQLDSVWIAARGQVSGTTIRIFGGRGSGGAVATPLDRAFVLVVVTLPTIIPFRCMIQRRLAMSAPRFGTSYEEFDKNIEVKTDNEKKALTLLNSEELRNAIVSFIKSTSNAFITSSEIVCRVSADRQILQVAREALNIANHITSQIKKLSEEKPAQKPV
jgi:hypothetical protein